MDKRPDAQGPLSPGLPQLWRPDVRPGEAGYVALGFRGVRISGLAAGFLWAWEGSDVRAGEAGCPGPIVSGG